MTRRRLLPVVGIMALASSLSACAATPGISAQGKRGSGVEPTTTSGPTPSAPATTSAVAPPPAAPTTSGGATSPSRSRSPASTSTTAAPATPSTVGSPPDVMGQSLTAAEQSLQAAGYTTAAHPWGGSCATPNQIMQQVPPSENEVQLYYCAQAT